MSRVRRSASFEIDQPAERLFPLFSAEGETEWVPGWTYEDVSGTGEMAEDYVFVTRSHDHGEEEPVPSDSVPSDSVPGDSAPGDSAAGEAVWIVKRYEPERYFVQFYRVEAGEKVGIVSVRCVEVEGEHGEARTRVEVGYEYVALSESGERFVRDFSAESYEAFIGEWKELLERYFASVGS